VGSDDRPALCRDSGVCRAIVDVPRNAAVGDEIRIRHLLKDPLRAHSISWTAFGVPGELLIPFVLAVLAALIGLPLSIWHLRFRRTPSAAAVGAVLSALFAVAVLMMVLSGEYTHPMLRVLGVVAGVAVVYWFAKATRLWNRP
jgi:hypothetical protein